MLRNIMIHPDDKKYFKFTGPQRLDKAIHYLEGLLEGISLDGKVTDCEMQALISWIGDNDEFIKYHPFNEIIPRIQDALVDGIFDEEERADVLWLCNKITTDDNFFSQTTSDMQRLQGILAGIVSDGRIEKEELLSLSEWMEQKQHLRSCWPYDEVDALLVSVLADGKIDESEHKELMEFFSEFNKRSGHKSVELKESAGLGPVKGICAVCPTIEFHEKTFCFTGHSERCVRKQLAEIIQKHNGKFIDRLTKDVHYLIIGAGGNPCWAYACYGRKVELAVKYRRDGSNLLLVHEYDFWDAIDDQ
jgi:hypothetical protein